MALILLGKTECRLCGALLEAGEELVSTSGSTVSKTDPLAPYQDAAMHRKCFLKWPQRESFVQKFNEYYEKNYRGIRFMREDGSIEDREPRPGHVV